MHKKPGQAARGTTTGRPIMVLLDVLGQRWTLRILWELQRGSATFRDLQQRCDRLSPTVLNKRLAQLRELGLVNAGEEGYQLSAAGRSLVMHFMPLHAWAEEWARSLV